MQREFGGAGNFDTSADYLRRFLEKESTGPEAQAAWSQLIAFYRTKGDVIGACSAFVRAAEDKDPPLYQVSSMANWLNGERELIGKMDVPERGALFKPMAALLEGHIKFATATDLSKLAWLHLHAGDDKRALEVAELGLKREPDNRHCQSLVDRLTQN
jgi:hypothetical protein